MNGSDARPLTGDGGPGDRDAAGVPITTDDRTRTIDRVGRFVASAAADARRICHYSARSMGVRAHGTAG